jgi:hypothetical protein
MFADWVSAFGFRYKNFEKRVKIKTRFRHGRLYAIYNREDETNRYVRLGQKEQV